MVSHSKIKLSNTSSHVLFMHVVKYTSYECDRHNYIRTNDALPDLTCMQVNNKECMHLFFPCRAARSIGFIRATRQNDAVCEDNNNTRCLPEGIVSASLSLVDCKEGEPLQQTKANFSKLANSGKLPLGMPV